MSAARQTTPPDAGDAAGALQAGAPWDTLLAAAAARLAAAGVADAGRDARLLARAAAGLGAAGFAVAGRDAPTLGIFDKFAAMIDRRAAREPVSHILGTRAFWRHEFRVTPDVLDPRPETEGLVAEALAGRPAARILDLGTGTGCILLSLLAEWPGAEGVGTDLSEPALAVARENAGRLGLAARTRLVRADWLDGVDGRFDLIVSNPPYISAEEHETLAPETRLHEPRMALTPGGDGLDAYRRIAAGAPQHLAPGGRLLLEIGPTQATAVSDLLAAAGLGPVLIRRDLDGRDRILQAQCVRKWSDP